MISFSSNSSSTSTSSFTHGLESRYHALTPQQLQVLGSSKGLQEFLPRAVNFLRRELTGHNATLIAGYLMGGDQLPEGLDGPATPISEFLKDHLHGLLRTQRYGFLGGREPAQKTFDKLDWLSSQVQELTGVVRQSFPYKACSALKTINQSNLLTISTADDVALFFRIIYRDVSNRDAQALAERWTAFCGPSLDRFMGWLEGLWSVGLSGREHHCLMQILDAMLIDDDFRHHCFEVMRRCDNNCASSYRFNLLTLQDNLLLLQANKGELNDLEIFQLGRSSFWTAELVRIVREHAGEGFFKKWEEDPKGLVLNMRVRLHDELAFSGVPIQPHDVSYSDVVQQALKVVRAKVLDIALGDGSERLQKALMQWPLWRQLVERRCAKPLQELDAQFAQLVDEHEEQAKTSSLSEGVLVEQCKKLMSSRDKARAELLSDLTGEVARQLAGTDVPCLPVGRSSWSQ